MEFNEGVIPHYREAKIPVDKLKKLVSLNEKYLREKANWYEINGKLYYFKSRDDYRLFTEQFFSKFGSKIMDLDTVDYEVSCMRTMSPIIKSKDEVTKIGLLSENFQVPDRNYYLVSELLNSEISDLVRYSGYSLESILTWLKDTLSSEDYERDKNFLIRLFISDAFLMQVDRNENNIGFEIPKMANISYKERLRPEKLKLHNDALMYLVEDQGIEKLKGFVPSKVYDNERILGVDHKNVQTYTSGMLWAPIFPYNTDLLFDDQQSAMEMQDVYDGLDPNLTELYMNYPNESKPYIERLAYDDEYRKIFEEFLQNNSQIHLKPHTQEYFEGIIKDRQEVFKKIASL